MNKKFLFFLILLLSIKLLSAQDIKYFFKILPQSYIPELNAKAKDSLLQGKGYYPADNDSEQVIVYKLEAFDSIKNFLRIEMTYETGQRGFRVFELRSFKTKSGTQVVVFSNLSGAPHVTEQNIISVFSYARNGKLKKIPSLGLITKFRTKDFLKPTSPDSIVKVYNHSFNINYELGYQGDNITLNCYAEFEKLRPWLQGNVIEFIWNGNHFIRQKPKFDFRNF